MRFSSKCPVGPTGILAWVLAIVLAMAVAIAAPAQAAGEDTPARARVCPGDSVTINAPAGIDVAAVCAGIARANRFFRACGLRTNLPVTIRLGQQLQFAPGMKALAIYNTRTRTISILSEKFRLRAWQASALGRYAEEQPGFISLLAHEHAHALVEHNRSRKIAWIASEYVAHVVQFHALDKPSRDALYAAFPAPKGREIGLSELNEFLFMLDPVRFLVFAHHHFESQPDKCKLLKSILAGRTEFPDLP